MDMNIQKYVTLAKTVEHGRHGVKLTSDGLKPMPYVRRLCEAYENLRMQVDGLNGLNGLNGLQAVLIRIGTFSRAATHWLPGTIRVFQRDSPNIDYELLLGDYTEIEAWIRTGRVDCGFLRPPAQREFDTIFLRRGTLMAIISLEHPRRDCKRFPLAAMCEVVYEKGAKAEISEIFERNGFTPKVRFTTRDDYAVMSMVESGLCVAILPELILR